MTMTSTVSDPVSKASSYQYPDSITSVEQLERELSEPTPGVIQTMRNLKGDVLILGVAGKMGPTLAMIAKRARDAAGVKRKIIGVARFSDQPSRKHLENHGIETIKADLLDDKQLANLPDCPNIVYMAGMKFGSSGQEALTWAMNTFLPGLVCQRYRTSKIVAFSTGNVYGLTPVSLGGSVEGDPLDPMGDYAISCAGRERMFEHFSKSLKIPVSVIRLNYATELRYGVLVDLATKVFNGETIDMAMGNVNVIWQADANAMTLQSFDDASSPPFLLNVAGPEMLSVRRVCQTFGKLMKKEAKLTGTESPNALLNNGQMGHRRYGYPRVPAEQLLKWTAEWVMQGGASLGKPTHFETRDGKF